MTCENVQVYEICRKLFDLVEKKVKRRLGHTVLLELEDLLQQYEKLSDKVECLILRKDLFFNMGCAYESGNNLEKAVAFYEKAIEVDAKDHQSLYNAGTDLCRLGLFEKAELYLSKALELEPNDPDYKRNFLYAKNRGV